MKPLLKILSWVVALVCPMSAGASWTYTHGPSSYTTRAICFDSSGNAFAATVEGGIFKSSDSGISWAQDSNGLGVYRNFYSLVCTPRGIILAGTYDATVFQTADLGGHWTVATRGGYFRTWVLAVSPTGVIYASMESSDGHQGYVTSSTDGGISWTAIPGYEFAPSISFDTSGNIHTTAFDASGNIEGPNAVKSNATQYVFCTRSGNIYLATTNGVLRSTNLGVTWADTVLPGERIVAFGENESGTVFAGSTAGRVWVSTDNGVTWSLHPGINAASAITAFAFSSAGTALVATATDGIYHSSNDGVSWVPGGITVAAALVTTSSGSVFASRADGAISILDPHIQFWSLFKTGSSIVAVSDSTVLVASGCIVRYRGDGDTGTRACLSYDPACADLDGVYRSSLSGLVGAGTVLVYAYGTANGYYNMYDFRGRIIGEHMVGSGLTIQSTNGGQSWQRILPTSCFAIRRMAAGPSGVVVCETSNGCQSVVSLDTGRTWKVLSDSCFQSLAITSTNTIYAIRGDGRIIRTYDAGAHWSVALDLAPLHNFATSLLVGPADLMIAGTSKQGVYYSIDGSHWTFMGNDLPQSAVGAMAVDSSGRLYVALATGVYRSDNSILTETNEPVNLPSTLALDVFPNPAGNVPTLSLTLVEPSTVSAELCDPLGRTVVLVPNELRPAGALSMRIPTTNAPSGLYMCRVHIGSRTFARSFVITR